MSDEEPKAAAVDRQVLSALRAALDEQGEGAMAQILGVFFEEGAKRLAAIEAALAGGDVRTVELCAHTLRGSAELLGARRLAGLSARLERAAGAQPRDALQALFAELRGEYEGVSRQLQDEL